jgi:hypothetical protein
LPLLFGGKLLGLLLEWIGGLGDGLVLFFFFFVVFLVVLFLGLELGHDKWGHKATIDYVLVVIVLDLIDFECGFFLLSELGFSQV